MSFLDRAKRAADEAGRHAKELSEQARQAAAENAERARQAASVAAEQAKLAADEAGRQAHKLSDKANAAAWDPATAEKAQRGLRVAKRGLQTAVERIDPAVLADVIIKATILQERANASLRKKGSPYRIAEIAIGAAIPPSITFSIARVDDPAAEERLLGGEVNLGGAEAASVDGHGATGSGGTGGAIVTLDGTELDDADLTELA